MGRSYLIPDSPRHVRCEAAGEYIQAPHWPFDREVLKHVRREMMTRGVCLIRALWDGQGWKAIEGSHRLCVAADIGQPITIQPVRSDYKVQHDNWSLGIVTAEYLTSKERGGRGPAAIYWISR